ncbi:MAG TPA: MBL fold metallo-hydrolase [Acetobacteraceae bacterium]|nr:MBL fold metallo-hydrolase [Acetobacteraceae bacterium]
MAITVTLNGVGEAFDPNEPNSSALVEAHGFTLLIDCGHSAVAALWRRQLGPDAIDAIYLTHHHADHVLGLVPLLDRCAFDGRRRKLSIHTTQWGIGHLRKLFELGFVRLDDKSPFPLEFHVASPGQPIGPFDVDLAPTIHGTATYAIMLSVDGRRFAYSGDGRPTDAALALYCRAHVLMHECYATRPEQGTKYHADLPTVAAIEGPERIGLYHVGTAMRDEMRRLAAQHSRLFFAETGMTFTV